MPSAPAPVAPATPEVATTTTVAPPRTLAAQPIESTSKGRSWRPFVFAALALAAAACWLVAGRGTPTTDDVSW